MRYSFGNGGDIEHSPLKTRFGSRTRICIHCGNETKRKIIDVEEKFKRIEQVFRYHCSTCNVYSSPFTQISYENNEKNMDLLYSKLLKYVKAEQFQKIWIDHSDTIRHEKIVIEAINAIKFIVTIADEIIEVPCTYTKRLPRYYESPIVFVKDKRYKVSLDKIRKIVEVSVK